MSIVVEQPKDKIKRKQTKETQQVRADETASALARIGGKYGGAEWNELRKIIRKNRDYLDSEEPVS